MRMTAIPERKVESEEGSKDRELADIFRLAEVGVDEETRRFIDEVLKFVPSEPQPEIQVFTSHQGAGNAR